MGESAVLFHSYSFAAPLSRNDSREDNTNHALSQSVSFGRFVTENLEWGKWSSFSHKKYVDEAEKYSQPGSVAQKKAFFEAHYKRIAEAKKAASASDDSALPVPKQQPECVAGLLNTLETLTKEEESGEELVLSNENVVVVAADSEEAGELLKKSGSVGGTEEDERRSITNSSSVFEKSETPAEKAMELVSSQITGATPVTRKSSMKKSQKPLRPRFRFFNFLRGNSTKSQDQIPSRTKRNKPFLCLCFQPEMVGETEAQRRN